MKRFVQGESRTQSTLLPELLDDYISESNPVRVIDVFVDELSLGKLGFEGVDPAETGRPAYHPSVLLKLYIYGYLNRIQSSRRLEREAQRNVELMWLTGRLTPDHKTIANFPQGQWQVHPQCLPSIRCPVSAIKFLHRSLGRHRRQQIQGRE
jgi:transposase